MDLKQGYFQFWYGVDEQSKDGRKYYERKWDAKQERWVRPLESPVENDSQLAPGVPPREEDAFPPN